MISEKIKQALNQYYHNRANQHVEKWDKEEDLKHLFTVAGEEGWMVEAVAGTFWFQSGLRKIKVNEKNFRTGGVSNIPADKPFGPIAELGDAILRKAGKR